MSDDKLWKVFSNYIRLRDSDENGNCSCITCGYTGYFSRFDCGHGIPRQHKATKFHEQNNHAQCKRCNAFEGGKREIYKEEINKRYGRQTWEKLEIMSRMTCKRDSFEILIMTEHYKKLVAQLRKEKNL